jgi:leader peptidase (prepilin peptidase)/N-methyltransferase
MSNITYVFPVILGWFAGWLVNYLSDVLPITRQFSQPACPHCGADFPLKEYLLFRPCRNGHPRPVRAWLAQVVILAMSVYTWINPPPKIEFFPGLILLIYFGAVFVIDLEHRLILHPTSIFGGIFGLVIGVIAHGISPTLLGALGGFGIMMTFYFFGVLFTRIRARRLAALGQEPDDEEALGSGDVILVTVLGLIVGWPLIWLCLLYSILLGGLVSLVIILWMVVSGKYKAGALMTFIPYGPYFLITAGLIVYFPKFLALFVPG